YAKYKDIFRKRVAQREEGKVQRHFGAAARAIEAERARTQPEASSKASTAGAAVESRGFRMVCSEPEKEPRKVDELYDAFLRAKQEAGEETSKLNRAGFNEFVRKMTKDLQAKKNCRDVEYVVETVDGQVKLKALVKSYPRGRIFPQPSSFGDSAPPFTLSGSSLHGVSHVRQP